MSPCGLHRLQPCCSSCSWGARGGGTTDDDSAAADDDATADDDDTTGDDDDSGDPLDADGDGYRVDVDCDDNDPAVHPGTWTGTAWPLYPCKYVPSRFMIRLSGSVKFRCASGLGLPSGVLGTR